MLLIRQADSNKCTCFKLFIFSVLYCLWFIQIICAWSHHLHIITNSIFFGGGGGAGVPVMLQLLSILLVILIINSLNKSHENFNWQTEMKTQCFKFKQTSSNWTFSKIHGKKGHYCILSATLRHFNH